MFHQGSGAVIPKKFNTLLETIKPKAIEILENTNFFVFIVSHHDDCTKLVKQIFPNARLIEFINDQYINQISKKIKTNLPVHNKEIKFTRESYKFDIGTLLCKTSFFDEIDKLLRHLGTDTYLDPKVYEYYEKYVALYQPYLNKA